jgi:hypothetical protein
MRDCCLIAIVESLGTKMIHIALIVIPLSVCYYSELRNAMVSYSEIQFPVSKVE